MKCAKLIAGVVGLCGFFGTAAYGVDPTYVIHISVDGGGSSYIQNQINLNLLPNFKKFQTEGAWTNNARTDYDYTITLPNHTSQITGRPVLNQNSNAIIGHGYTSNSDPAAGVTLASNKGSYVASVFDVVHDNGKSTAMFTTKTKFSLYDTSYNATNGAADVTGVDNGKDKINTYYENDDTDQMFLRLLDPAFSSTNLQTNKYNYTFIHIADPDEAGHASGWGSSAYNTALQYTDTKLGQLFTLVTTDPTFIGKTAIVLTADHGGGMSTNVKDHSNATEAIDYTIPFYVWGAGVSNNDLYALNTTTRLNPGTGRPLYFGVTQPVRNGDSANLELDMLGLGPVPGSYINFAQNLAVPEPASLAMLALGGTALLVRRKRG